MVIKKSKRKTLVRKSKVVRAEHPNSVILVPKIRKMYAVRRGQG